MNKKKKIKKAKMQKNVEYRKAFQYNPVGDVIAFFMHSGSWILLP